jgi:hypothetical protein
LKQIKEIILQNPNSIYYDNDRQRDEENGLEIPERGEDDDDDNMTPVPQLGLTVSYTIISLSLSLSLSLKQVVWYGGNDVI